MNDWRTAQVFDVTTTVYATVTIINPDVTERVTGPGGDEWRSQFYPSIETAEDVAEHFAFNAIANGVHDVSRLDGWADCDPKDVTIDVDWSASTTSTRLVQ